LFVISNNGKNNVWGFELPTPISVRISSWNNLEYLEIGGPVSCYLQLTAKQKVSFLYLSNSIDMLNTCLADDKYTFNLKDDISNDIRVKMQTNL